MMVYKIDFYAYLPKYKYIFFFISIYYRIWSRIGIFLAEPDQEQWLKMSNPNPLEKLSSWPSWWGSH